MQILGKHRRTKEEVGAKARTGVPTSIHWSVGGSEGSKESRT